MVGEGVVARGEGSTDDDDRYRPVGHEQRHPEGDVGQFRPPEERVGQDTENLRVNAVLEPSRADGDGLGGGHNDRAGRA